MQATLITDIKQLDFSKKYTYSDYLTWNFKERVELIKGRLFKMSPAPNRKHQRLVTDLTISIGTFLKSKDCQVFTAPFDVRLPISTDVIGESTYTVLQPDVVVICDESKLDEQGCNGAPDLIVEVLSPGNTQKEMQDKFEVYEESGVKEYWIVEPKDEFVIVYTLNKKGQYIGSKPFCKGDTAKSEVLNGFELAMDELFQ